MAFQVSSAGVSLPAAENGEGRYLRYFGVFLGSVCVARRDGWNCWGETQPGAGKELLPHTSLALTEGHQQHQ